MARNATIRFRINYRLLDNGLLDSMEFVLGESGTGNPPGNVLILEALLPADTNESSRYFVALVLDNVSVTPFPPSAGFESMPDLYNWIQANWHIYGKWFLTAEKLVLYLNAGPATSGALAVTAVTSYVFTALIPPRDADHYYQVLFIKDGADVIPLFPDDIAQTAEDILLWVRQHWSDYGNWTIEGNRLVLTSDKLLNAELLITTGMPGGFSHGFSTGFDA